jgi:hypothetical protein
MRPQSFTACRRKTRTAAGPASPRLPAPPAQWCRDFYFCLLGGGLGFGGFMILALSLVFWGLLALFFLFFGLF